MTLFSPKTQQFLSEYGWFPEHCVDLSDAITKLSKEGFDIFEAALVVLQSLQGLQTRTPTGASMDFSATIGLGTYDDIALWMRAHRIRLYPLGDWSSYTMYLDEQKRLYVTDFAHIARVGETTTDGFDAIVSGCGGPATTLVPPKLC
jgi:hypothetical protein